MQEIKVSVRSFGVRNPALVKVRGVEKNEDLATSQRRFCPVSEFGIILQHINMLNSFEDGKYIALWVKRINCRNTVHKELPSCQEAIHIYQPLGSSKKRQDLLVTILSSKAGADKSHGNVDRVSHCVERRCYLVLRTQVHGKQPKIRRTLVPELNDVSMSMMEHDVCLLVNGPWMQIQGFATGYKWNKLNEIL